jgi:IstB-like ATP binding protein
MHRPCAGELHLLSESVVYLYRRDASGHAEVSLPLGTGFLVGVPVISLILHGKTGRGKTHLAVAIGYRAIQNGFETLFTTAAELIEDLSNASKRGSLQESLATYTHPHALIIDEVGYLAYGPDAANVLFHVVNDRHLRKRPMIFTTNKPMNDWGKVLHDEDMAAAILDRVLERGRFIHLDGPSGRTRHLNPEETLPENAKTAQNFRNWWLRFSGTHMCSSGCTKTKRHRGC